MTRGQRRALAALLAHSTIAEAATAAGLGERTVYRYLADAAFRDALQQEQDRLLSATRRRLAEYPGHADEIHEIFRLVAERRARLNEVEDFGDTMGTEDGGDEDGRQA